MWSHLSRMAVNRSLMVEAFLLAIKIFFHLNFSLDLDLDCSLAILILYAFSEEALIPFNLWKDKMSYWKMTPLPNKFSVDGMEK